MKLTEAQRRVLSELVRAGAGDYERRSQRYFLPIPGGMAGQATFRALRKRKLIEVTDRGQTFAITPAGRAALEGQNDNR